MNHDKNLQGHFKRTAWPSRDAVRRLGLKLSRPLPLVVTHPIFTPSDLINIRAQAQRSVE